MKGEDKRDIIAFLSLISAIIILVILAIVCSAMGLI